MYLFGMITHPLLPSPPLQEAGSTATAVALQLAADVSSIVLAVVAILLMMAAIGILVQLRRLLRSLQSQVQPVTDRARVAAENVEYISAVVRDDVQSVRSSVTGLSERLRDASQRMEERVEEFNALMDVVQGEAESVLLDTAAVVQGVRAGARIVGDGVARGSLEEAADVPNAQDEVVDDAEGASSATEEAAHKEHEGP